MKGTNKTLKTFMLAIAAFVVLTLTGCCINQQPYPYAHPYYNAQPTVVVRQTPPVVVNHTPPVIVNRNPPVVREYYHYRPRR